ncbi:MAG: class I SAM-dependent methyltransferase [Candidatus Freyarchaeota archaeon]|nr:class I SAM-dependent methyltransferase [Candidatus Jordarchaeia archaeon]MBS7268400.1 class I SAM-dependent methyltransferase [Candidatus Jordarchaeia archaeon]MBS7280179.1 class I SAM-dependent methyltransferase [Candidatus Jordarchaeia archaeon]
MSKKKTTRELWDEFVGPFLPPTHLLYAPYTEYTFKGIERGQEIVNLLRRFTKLENKRVLDLGHGSGGISIAFAMGGAQIVGIDIEKMYPLIARSWAQDNKQEVNLLRASGLDLPFRDETFDIVSCNDVIEHVEDAEKCVKEISRVLKPRGLVYVTCPNRIAPIIVMRDGHYALPLESLLPRKLADIYVRAMGRAQKTYVPFQPTFPKMIHVFKKEGIKLYSLELSLKIKSFHNPPPGEAGGKIKQKISKILPGIVDLYAKHFYLKWICPLWRFVGIKN